MPVFIVVLALLKAVFNLSLKSHCCLHLFSLAIIMVIVNVINTASANKYCYKIIIIVGVVIICVHNN